MNYKIRQYSYSDPSLYYLGLVVDSAVPIAVIVFAPEVEVAVVVVGVVVVMSALLATSSD